MPETAQDLRTAAKGSENVVYDYGVAQTPEGFAKLALTTSGLNSGDVVLSAFQWAELDRTTHLMAHTTEKIYEHDRVNTTWADRTQSGLTMASDIYHPVSYAEVGHDDTAIYYDDDTARDHAYHHLITCDGGMTNIQRWAGKYETDFADLVGGGGYHDGTTHRALQVSLSQHNRLILVSPYTYSSSSLQWVAHPQQVRWPTIGKIQTWTGTGSGYAELMDTGGINVWSASLASQHIIYQSNGIWTLMYVGGETVFDPEPYIRDLGLLSYHLLISHNNVHYFMGTDMNIYAYYGGTVIKAIGNDIQKYLIDDLDQDYQYLCWMMMGQKAKFLWVLIVEKGKTYPTKVYRRNMITEKWHVRDFSSKFTSGGVTTICLAAATAYTIGESYQKALDSLSLYDQSDAEDATVRYGDKLVDTSRVLSKDYSGGSWKAGGFDYSKAGGGYSSDFTTNDLLKVVDGSEATNVRWGTHFYTVYDVSTEGFSVYGTQDVIAQGDHGIADSSTTIPADMSVVGNKTLEFYSTCSFDAPGQTYNQGLEQVRTQEKVILGDSTGYIYVYDETYTDDDGALIEARHLTPITDFGEPGRYKMWPGFSVVAKGSALTARWRIDNFDTSETGWTDFTQTLNTTEFNQYNFWIQSSSKCLQIAIEDFSGGAFTVRELEIMTPVMEDNR